MSLEVQAKDDFGGANQGGPAEHPASAATSHYSRSSLEVFFNLGDYIGEYFRDYDGRCQEFRFCREEGNMIPIACRTRLVSLE